MTIISCILKQPENVELRKFWEKYVYYMDSGPNIPCQQKTPNSLYGFD